MRYLSLFSGIGMHDLGFERAGWQCCGQVEIDPFCQAVLEKHWPIVPRWSDVRDVRATDVVERCGHIELITGGFMCTDVSVAGKGAGLTRFTRSGITFRNLFRLARQLRPDWLVIENVPALRTRGYDRCVRPLERIGYTCRALVVSAGSVGAPHRRQRVWILANTNRIGCELKRGGGLLNGKRTALGNHVDGFGSARHPGELADTNVSRATSRISGQSESTFEGLAEVAHDDSHRFEWPAGPGEPQHEWEAPRLVHAECEPGQRGHAVAIGQTQGRVTSDWSGSSCSTTGKSQREWARNSGQRPAGGPGSRGCSVPESSSLESQNPRLAESSLGSTASRDARRLDGFARRNALKALGNGNPPQVAELIARTINATAAALREAVAPC